MNIIKFISDFPDEKSCRMHFNGIREQQGYNVRYVGVRSIVGYRLNDNGNAQNVDFTRINSNGGLYISRVLHKIYIATDEKVLRLQR